ncbi:unnamed protein product [Adineta steineri]|uniref:Innexin n=1 Tax=Adineta steineri TaxID=433720 RepID=A0A818JYJ4_9BILA|nr:unnamed protein product [Adineta steineri]
MASLLKDALEQVGQLHKTDDDLIDRLNHRFTVILLVIFSAFVSTKQFIGEPISCWTPAHFSGAQIGYTNSICWLKGTYYLAVEQQRIPQRAENNEFRIAYYQYVPYMLLVMAGLFYIPHMFWRNVGRHIGFDLRSIIQNMRKDSNITINQVALHLHVALQYNSLKNIVYRGKPVNRLLEKFQRSYRYRNFLCFIYILVKILYMINCFCQFYLLSMFLSFPFHKFGYEWLLSISQRVYPKRNTESNDSKWFPRVVMCDFMVRHLGSNHHWMSIQCNLPINLFNELVFLIIWAWFIFLSGLTLISFISCLISIYTNVDHTLIRKYLYLSLPQSKVDDVDKFIEDYLRRDGILVLRIIAQNTNDILMTNLIGAIFEVYADSIENKTNDTNSRNEIQWNEDYVRTDGDLV